MDRSKKHATDSTVNGSRSTKRGREGTRGEEGEYNGTWVKELRFWIIVGPVLAVQTSGSIAVALAPIHDGEGTDEDGFKSVLVLRAFFLALQNHIASQID